LLASRDHRSNSAFDVAAQTSGQPRACEQVAAYGAIRQIEHCEQRPVDGCARRLSIEPTGQVHDGTL
jgi:hypothetical protein